MLRTFDRIWNVWILVPENAFARSIGYRRSRGIMRYRPPGAVADQGGRFGSQAAVQASAAARHLLQAKHGVHQVRSIQATYNHCATQWTGNDQLLTSIGKAVLPSSKPSFASRPTTLGAIARLYGHLRQ